MTEPLLQVQDLGVRSKKGGLLVDSLSFSVARGECLGVAGESGSGKTLTTLALLSLLPPDLTATGSVRFEGKELLSASETLLGGIRGRGIALIPQMSAEPFDPLCPVGSLILEALANAFPGCPRASLKAKILALFEKLHLPEPEKIFRRYPHELSGGQRQRCLIAAALALDPALVIADEPATALDAGNQRELVSLFKEVMAEGTALLFISHDLALIANLASDVLVMQKGRAVEAGPVARLLAPESPYAQELVSTRRAIGARFQEVMR